MEDSWQDSFTASERNTLKRAGLFSLVPRVERHEALTKKERERLNNALGREASTTA